MEKHGGREIGNIDSRAFVRLGRKEIQAFFFYFHESLEYNAEVVFPFLMNGFPLISVPMPSRMALMSALMSNPGSKRVR